WDRSFPFGLARRRKVPAQPGLGRGATPRWAEDAARAWSQSTSVARPSLEPRLTSESRLGPGGGDGQPSRSTTSNSRRFADSVTGFLPMDSCADLRLARQFSKSSRVAHWV